MVLMALGISQEDEVIVPDSTWVGSVFPISWLGAKPVFVDVLEDTWCIDPQKIEEAITPKTKAIVVVHLYGNLCEMDEIIALGEKYNIPIIEDAAEALGSEYKGKKAGVPSSPKQLGELENKNNEQILEEHLAAASDSSELSFVEHKQDKLMSRDNQNLMKSVTQFKYKALKDALDK